MKKMTLVFTLALVVSLLFAAGIREDVSLEIVDAKPHVATESVAFSVPMEVELDDPSGREVANIGVPGVLEGTLHHVKDEWYLESDGIMYELHMGIYGHNEPGMFSEGAQAVVSGFIHHQHVAPILIQTPQTSRGFWSEDRFPLWAGGGAGRNQVEYSGERGEANPVSMGK